MKLQQFLFLVTLILAAAIARAPGAADEAAALAVLSSNSGTYEKAMACDDLARAGTAKAVPVLAKLLADEQLSDYARNALEQIPDASAGEALLAATKTLKGSLLVGVVITLGDRGDEAAVPALQKMATGPDSAVADAALSSLGLIADDDAAGTLIAVMKDGSADARLAAAQAALVAAERRAVAGKSTADLLAAVKAADVPEHVQAAAAAK